MTSLTGSAWRILEIRKKLAESSRASEEDGWLSLAREALGWCRTRCGGGGGQMKSQDRKILPLPPYVEKLLNSKVIKKSFVPEQRSCYVFFVVRDSYLYGHSIYVHGYHGYGTPEPRESSVFRDSYACERFTHPHICMCYIAILYNLCGLFTAKRHACRKIIIFDGIVDFDLYRGDCFDKFVLFNSRIYVWHIHTHTHTHTEWEKNSRQLNVMAHHTVIQGGRKTL